jgi:hypothetical protein
MPVNSFIQYALSLNPVLLRIPALGHLEDMTGQYPNAWSVGGGNPRIVPANGGGFALITPASADRIEIAHGAEQTLTAAISLFVGFARPIKSQVTSERLISKWDLSGTQYSFRFTATSVALFDGIGSSPTNVSVDDLEYTSIALSGTDGATAECYGNGNSLGAGGGSLDLSNTAAADITLSNLYTGSSQCRTPVQVYAVFPTALTAAQQSMLHYLFERTVWPSVGAEHAAVDTQVPYNLLIDGDMESVGIGDWTVVGGTMTKETSDLIAGTQCGRLTGVGGGVFVYNTFRRGVIGRTYRVRGYARGDGIATYPRINNAAVTLNYWIGTIANTWQRFDFTVVCDHPIVALFYSVIAGYAEFDEVSITDVEILANTVVSTLPISVEAVTPNGRCGPWTVTVGSLLWEYSTTARSQRMMRSSVLTSTYYKVSNQVYGAWYTRIKRQNFPNTNWIGFIASQATSPTTAGYNGYQLLISGNEEISIEIFTNGANVGTLMKSAVDAIPIDADCEVFWTRNDTGLFSLYLRAPSTSNVWGLVGTGTDNVHQVCNFMYGAMRTNEELSDFTLLPNAELLVPNDVPWLAD